MTCLSQVSIRATNIAESLMGYTHRGSENGKMGIRMEIQIKEGQEVLR